MTTLEHSSAFASNPAPATSHRVLVVDDHEPVRRLFTLALETAGFVVAEACSPRDAQRQLDDPRPDAVILDLKRSDREGLDLLAHLRAISALDRVPVIFLAACGDDELRWAAMREGADWFGLRPIGMAQLTQRVDKLVRSGRPRLRAIGGCRYPRAWVSHLKLVG